MQANSVRGSVKMHYLEPQERECNVMTAKNLNNVVDCPRWSGSSEDSALLVAIVIRAWPQDLHRIVQETKDVTLRSCQW